MKEGDEWEDTCTLGEKTWFPYKNWAMKCAKRELSTAWSSLTSCTQGDAAHHPEQALDKAGKLL